MTHYLSAFAAAFAVALPLATFQPLLVALVQVAVLVLWALAARAVRALNRDRKDGGGGTGAVELARELTELQAPAERPAGERPTIAPRRALGGLLVAALALSACAAGAGIASPKISYVGSYTSERWGKCFVGEVETFAGHGSLHVCARMNGAPFLELDAGAHDAATVDANDGGEQ